MLSAIAKRRWLCAVTFLCHLSWLPTTGAYEPAYEPDGPVKIVVYTGPGGLLDTTARRFADVARRYSQATFVVENRPGAGGLVAMDSVLQAAPDGRTLLAVTKSNIAKIMLAQRVDLLEAFDWRAMLLSETECLIVRADSSVQTLTDLAKATGATTPHQVWLGPGAGGLDHVTAAKVWRELGIHARWVPYSSGNEALSALMGGQGQVYVGNPSDALENPLLRILAISNPERIPPFENVPVFRELGLQGLDHQFMWRGFALPRGCRPEITAWYDHLFQQVTDDREWQSMWQSEGALVFYRDAQQFREQIRTDASEFASYHAEMGLATSSAAQPAAPRFSRVLAIGLTLFVVATCGWASWRAAQGWGLLPALLPCAIQVASLWLYWQTISYPIASDEVGAAALPRLWLGLLIVAVPWSFIADRVPRAGISADSSTMPTETTKSKADPYDRYAGVGWFLAALLGYVVTLPALGYAPATFVWLTAGGRLLGYRRWILLLAAGAAWIALTYVGFEILLHVPLPRGWVTDALWERLSWKR